MYKNNIALSGPTLAHTVFLPQHSRVSKSDVMRHVHVLTWWHALCTFKSDVMCLTCCIEHMRAMDAMLFVIVTKQDLARSSRDDPSRREEMFM